MNITVSYFCLTLHSAQCPSVNLELTWYHHEGQYQVHRMWSLCIVAYISDWWFIMLITYHLTVFLTYSKMYT